MPASQDSAPPIRIAVLGATGIGRYHVREFATAGAEIVAIFGSSTDSVAQTAIKLTRDYGKFGVHPKPLTSLDEVFAYELDAVAIATPNELHSEAAVRALLSGLKVFCEKPLFWQAGLTRERAKPILAEFAMAGARERLCVNTSNASFITCLRDRGLLPDPPREFDFELRSSGLDCGRAIGIDLLPHAMSVLHEFMPATVDSEPTRLSELEICSAAHLFDARFRFARTGADSFDIPCHFRLEKYPDRDKHMAFTLNGVRFERTQRIDAEGAYRVALCGGGQRIEVEDPFTVYIRGFLDAIRHGGPMPVSFETSARILLDSLQLLEAARDSE